MATGSSSLECCGTNVATVLGNSSATPVTVTHTGVPPAGIAQITNCPEQLEGSLTVVLKDPVPSVAVPEVPKLTAPGPLDSEKETGTPAGNGVPSGWTRVPLKVKACPHDADPGVLPDDPGPTV